MIESKWQPPSVFSSCTGLRFWEHARGFRTLLVIGLAAIAVQHTAFGEKVLFVDSTGEQHVVDTDKPGEYGMPAGPPHASGKSGGITFNVYYRDEEQHSGIGFDDPDPSSRDARQARVQDVVSYLNSILDHTGVCDIVFNLSETDHTGSMAFESALFSAEPGFSNGYAYDHITTGTDPFPGVPDIVVTVDFGYNWNSESRPPSSEEWDLQSALLHEITHGLGLISLARNDGTSDIGAPDVFSRWNSLLRTGNGKLLWAGNPPAFQGVPSDLTGNDNGIRFVGSHATAAFGTPPRVYSPNQFQLGSSLSHWQPGSVPSSSVMDNDLNPQESARQYQALEKAALNDLGYVVTNAGSSTAAIHVTDDGPAVIDVEAEIDYSGSSVSLDKAILLVKISNLSGTWQEVASSHIPKPFLLEPNGERLLRIETSASTGVVVFETDWDSRAALLMFESDVLARLSFGSRLRAPTTYGSAWANAIRSGTVDRGIDAFYDAADAFLGALNASDSAKLTSKLAQMAQHALEGNGHAVMNDAIDILRVLPNSWNLVKTVAKLAGVTTAEVLSSMLGFIQSVISIDEHWALRDELVDAYGQSPLSGTVTLRTQLVTGRLPGSEDHFPSGKIVYPPAGSTVTGTTSVECRGADSRWQVSQMTLFWSPNGNTWTPIQSTVQNPATISVDFEGLPSGTVHLALDVRNSVNVIAHKVGSITVENEHDVPPALRVKFLEDVTIPDYTRLNANQSFTKKWRVQNTGTQTWLPSYSLRSVSGSRMSGADSPIGVSVSPGSVVDLTVNMVSPAGTGLYIGYWQLSTETGVPFGPELYVIIRVPEGVMPAETFACQYQQQQPSGVTEMRPGQGYTFSLAYKNVGTTTWVNGPNGVSTPGYIELRSCDAAGNVADNFLIFDAPSWIGPGNRQRPCTMKYPVVGPGDVALFEFHGVLAAGTAPGEYKVYFRPYHAAGGYISDWGHACFTIRVPDTSAKPPAADDIKPRAHVDYPNGGEEVFVNSDVTVRWTASDNVGVESVKLCLSADGGTTWMPPRTVPNSGSESVTMPASPCRAKIKVTAYDAAGNPGEDESDASFNVILAHLVPDVPFLHEPGIYSPSGRYPIQWSVSPHAVRYVLAEDTDSAFPHPELTETTATEVMMSGKANGTYYYRVRAIGPYGDASDWSDVRDMEVRVNQPPLTPGNPSPANGATGVPRTGAVLSWTGGDPDGTAQYAVALTSDPNLVPHEMDGVIWAWRDTVVQPLTDYPLASGTTYYWWIVARDNDGMDTLSPRWSFTTEYTLPDLVPLNLQVAGMISRTSPVTVSTTIRNQGTFASFVSHVNLYYSTVAGAKQEILASSITVPALEPGQQYPISQEVTLTHLQSGTTYVVAEVTSGGTFVESNTDNNIASLPITFTDTDAPSIAWVYINYEANDHVNTGHDYEIRSYFEDNMRLDYADIEISSDAGATFTSLATGLPLRSQWDGVRYPWNAPTSLPVAPDILQVRVTAWDGDGNSSVLTSRLYDVLDGTAPAIDLVSPDGGEIWDMASTHEITWSITSPNALSWVQVWFYYGTTRTYLTIMSDPYATSYQWTLPNSFSTTSGKIRIYAADVNGNKGEGFSDGFFTVNDTSAPPPAPWHDPEPLTSLPPSSQAYHEQPRVAVDTAGNVHVVYLYHEDGTQTTPSLDNIYYRKWNGSSWSAQALVYSLSQEAGLSSYQHPYGLRLRVDSQQRPHVVWQSWYGNNPYTENNQKDVFYTYCESSTWSAPVNLSQGIRGTYQDAALTWANVASLPVTTYGTAAAAEANGKLYVLGAYTSNSTREFDPATGLWTTKATIPGDIYDGGAATVSGKIYAVGAWWDGYPMRVYDVSGNSWTTGASLPTGRWATCVVAVGGYVYVIGGWNGSTVFATTEMYNPSTNSWTSRANLQTARCHAAAAVVDGKIYVIGGQSSGGNGLFSPEVYDPATNTWTAVEPSGGWMYQSTRSCAIAGVSGGKIYICGGYNSNATASLRTIDVYDPVAQLAYPIDSPMQTKRAELCGAMVGGKMYAVAGYDGTQALSSVEAATFTTDFVGAISNAPDMFVGPDDKIHVVWGDGGCWRPDGGPMSGYTYTGQNDVYYRVKDTSNNWSSASQLTTTGVARDPSLTGDSAGNMYLAFLTYGSYPDITYMSYSGGSWSSPAIAVAGGDWNEMVDITIACTPDNLPHMTWSHWDSALGTNTLYYSSFDGASWALPTNVAVLSSWSPKFSLSIDSRNRPHIAWINPEYPSKLFWSMKDGDQWLAPTQLHYDSQSIAENSCDTAISRMDDEMHVVWIGKGANNHSEVFHNHANMNFATDIFPPSVWVVRPYADESLSIGTSYNIQWNTSDSFGVVSADIELSTDNGATWSPIASSYTGGSPYPWTVANAEATSAKIRVTARDAAANAGIDYSGVFSISDLTAPTVTVLSPNGGETWESGAEHPILWSATDNVGVTTVDISYSSDGGSTWIPLATGESNDGTYPWTVPSNYSTNCQVRVQAYDAKGYETEDQSNGSFAIVAPNIPPAQPHNPAPADQGTVDVDAAQISWLCNDDNGDALVYDVYLAQHSPLEPSDKLVTGTPDTHVDLPGLSEGSTYYWQVVVSDGHTSVSGPIWALLAINPVDAPGNVTALSGVDGIQVQWADQSDNETSFRIERKNGLEGVFEEVGTAGASTGGFVDAAVTPGSEYVYRVIAVGTAAESGPSNEAIVATANHAPLVPSVPVPPDSSTDVAVTASFAWTGGDPDPGDSVLYELMMQQGASTPISMQVLSSPAFTPPAPLEGYQPYQWKIVAKDGAGLTAEGPIWAFTTGPGVAPAAPASLEEFAQAKAGSGAKESDTITIVWADESDNEDGFCVERRMGSEAAFTEIGRTEMSFYEDTDAFATCEYHYRVRAFNDWGYSDYLQEIVVSPPGGPVDTDEDGLTDCDELAVYSTDPADPDSDHDGLTDSQELLWDGDTTPNIYDPVTNPTGTDLDPNNPDTDGDGVNDGTEAAFGFDPLNPDDAAAVPALSKSCLGVLAGAFAGAGLLCLLLFGKRTIAQSHKRT
jgi:hypothetical protein